MAEHDVLILHCDWRGVPTGITTPAVNHTRVATRHHAQAKLSLPRCKRAWSEIVRAKVIGQSNNVEGLPRKKLRSLSRAVRSGDPTNVEAQAAKLYWKAISNGEHFRRVPGEGVGRNALLDYGYAVLRGLGVRAVFSAGLWPALGIHHAHRSNAFSLVDDLIEPFRPVVDNSVFLLDDSDSLDDPNVKRLVVSSCDQPFSDLGYSAASELRNLAQRLGNYVEGNADQLEVKPWGGSPNESR